MGTVAELEAIVRREVEDYHTPGIKSTSYYVEDSERKIYTVVVVPDYPRPFKTQAVVMARIVDDLVVIDEDTTDRPLYKELIRAGIPREKIVLLYAGEEIPGAKVNE